MLKSQWVLAIAAMAAEIEEQLTGMLEAIDVCRRREAAGSCACPGKARLAGWTGWKYNS